jgi:RNA polymerase sigma-70 factor (ECF subfamily)
MGATAETVVLAAPLSWSALSRLAVQLDQVRLVAMEFRGMLRYRNFVRAGTFDEVTAPVNTEADSDVELMLAVQRGDASAFERLFEKHIAGVVGFATQFVGSRARAEELAQDVFLQVYKSRARYEPRARFSTWLYRMVTNACLSEVRRADYRGRMQSMDQPVGDSDDPPQFADAAERSSEDDVASQETIQRMRKALDELPPQQRAALLLARVEGFSYEEVSESLSCSVSAVKSLVHRATVTLRDRLKEYRV